MEVSSQEDRFMNIFKERCAVALFTKTPELTPVKTRLAKSIGERKAEEFFTLASSAMEAVVKEAERISGGAIKGVWAVAEEEGIQSERWSRLPRIWTGEGCLGERQWRVSSELSEEHEMVLLTGCDAPQISPLMLLEAYQALCRHDIVFAPATDGGYTLLGLRRAIKKEIWTAIPYSSAETYSAFLSSLKSAPENYTLAPPLPTLCDVDEKEDLIKLKEYLSENEGALLPAQSRFLSLQV